MRKPLRTKLLNNLLSLLGIHHRKEWRIYQEKFVGIGGAEGRK